MRKERRSAGATVSMPCGAFLNTIFCRAEKMPPPNRQNATPPARPHPQWPVIFVTLLIGVTAIWLAWPQVFPGPAQANAMTLPNLNQRASALAQVTNLVQRDSYCVPLSAYGRALDRALPPDARVFLSGMIGKDEWPEVGVLLFSQKLSFPARSGDIAGRQTHLSRRLVCSGARLATRPRNSRRTALIFAADADQQQ